MSADALSNFLKRNISKIFEEELREELEGVTHKLTLNRSALNKLLQGNLKLSESEADDAFSKIFGSLNKHRSIALESGDLSGTSVWVASSVKTKLNPNKVKNPYNSFFNWKTNLHKNVFKDLEYGSKLETFGEQIHLGHGAGGGAAVVTHRSIKATRKLMTRGAPKGVKTDALVSGMEGVSLEVSSVLGKIDLKVKATDAFTARGKVKKKYHMTVELQWGKTNISEGQQEKKIKRAVDKFIKSVIDNPGAYVELGGSPSMISWVDKALDTAIIGKKKIKDQNKTVNASTSIKSKVTPKKKKKFPLGVSRLRDKKGRFTSAASIQQLIQAQITEQVKDNMGEGGSLVNRTGRFAESVTITNVTQSRQGSLTAFYNYMKYPYQTFERGFKQGSTRRDPRLLIHKSIREIAQKLVHRKLNIKTRRV
jgi:hypothetical protein